MPAIECVETAALRRLGFTPPEWLRLSGFYGAVALLHILGWGLYLHYASRHASLVGLGFAAYSFGLRHAFDADHIAAVDDTVRLLLQRGQRPLGTGFFFSLGHAAVVLAMTLATVLATAAVRRGLPQWVGGAGLLGTAISGVFLWLVGILNLIVLVRILRLWRRGRQAAHGHSHLDQILSQRGFLNRLFGGAMRRIVGHSWQMLPIGFLFGLGFDTASEIGLLALAAGATAGALPIGATLCLPLIFAAGMSVMDTTDGVLMVKAYSWAFVNPVRKIFYNVTITGLSVAVALLIGSIELFQVVIGLLRLHGGVFDWMARLDFGVLGYAVVGVFLFAWILSTALWKWGRLDPLR